nr:unnamed protein product [Callosobruchus analis]
MSLGLGYEIAVALASRGCKVVIADRIAHESIRDELIRKTDNPNISIYHMDLASFASIRAFAEQLKKNEDKVDILFNNAGVAGNDHRLTEDGLDFVHQINYYGGFLLTHLLLGMSRKGYFYLIIIHELIDGFSPRSSLTRVKQKFDHQKPTN